MMTAHQLLDHARLAAERAWSPYSRIKVGCALVSGSGEVFTGCNVENASYGLTICAERSTIFSGVAAEGPEFRVRELVVIALGHEFPPCGACRQVIAEFASAEAKVWFLQNGELTSLTMKELLPASFSLAR